MKNSLTLIEWLDKITFDAFYSRSLIYNTCWEDPTVDRMALMLKPEDTMLVITSAGCNVLDYALTGPKRIHAVDANPRQTALLELKIAGIRLLEFSDFFALFGDGYHREFHDLYYDSLRAEISDFARNYWDSRLNWFSNPRWSFYFYGLSGIVARAFKAYLRIRPALNSSVSELFQTRNLEDQREIYNNNIEPLIWSPWVKWVLSRQFTMNLLGVPHPQRKQVQAQHERGVAGFVRDSVDYVFRQLPAWTNYFWSVYVRGRYTRDCCPEYLKAKNFAALKTGLVDRIFPHTCTVTEFLQQTEECISKFVLLDHMDWMSSYYPEALAEEWASILEKATTDARIIFRSAHSSPTYLNRIELGTARRLLIDHLVFHKSLAEELQKQDRVHTYAGFHIADVKA